MHLLTRYNSICDWLISTNSFHSSSFICKMKWRVLRDLIVINFLFSYILVVLSIINERYSFTSMHLPPFCCEIDLPTWTYNTTDLSTTQSNSTPNGSKPCWVNISYPPPRGETPPTQLSYRVRNVVGVSLTGTQCIHYTSLCTCVCGGEGGFLLLDETLLACWLMFKNILKNQPKLQSLLLH